MAAFSGISHGCSSTSQTSIGPPMTHRASYPDRSGIGSLASSSTASQRDTVALEELPQRAGMLAGDVLEDQEFQGKCLRVGLLDVRR